MTRLAIDYHGDGDPFRLVASGAALAKADVHAYPGEDVLRWRNWRQLNLDPGKVYQLLRPPREMERAAEGFEVPLVWSHEKPRVMGRVRSPGFDCPLLRARIIVWAPEAIAAIENGARRQLSAAYHCAPGDMRPGTYEGAYYDGVMRDIRPIYCSLSERGRDGVGIDDSASIEIWRET
jgi:hypothetical protein